MGDGFIEIVALDILEPTPEFYEFGVFWEVRVGHVDCEWSGEQFKLFELMISEEFYIFGVGLFEEGDVVFEFLLFFEEMLFALYFFDLFGFEVVLVL